jgi:hypothetical protein
MNTVVLGPMIFAHTGHWIADLLLLAPVLLILGWVLIANYRDRRRQHGSGDRESAENGPKHPAGGG